MSEGRSIPLYPVCLFTEDLLSAIQDHFTDQNIIALLSVSFAPSIVISLRTSSETLTFP